MTAASESGGASLPPDANRLTPIIPHADMPDGTGVLVHVRVVLDGSSLWAQRRYAGYIQEYAEKLANESARQEASARAPGARTVEITESAVIRARESIELQTAMRQRPNNLWEAVALAGVPILSGAAGVAGGYLHSIWQYLLFAVCAFGAIACVLYQLKRRLL